MNDLYFYLSAIQIILWSLNTFYHYINIALGIDINSRITYFKSSIGLPSNPEIFIHIPSAEGIRRDIESSDRSEMFSTELCDLRF